MGRDIIAVRSEDRTSRFTGKLGARATGLAALLAIIVLVAGCSSGHQSGTSPTAAKLAARVIPAPVDYSLDTTAGAVGQISSSLFAEFGGTKAEDKEFVAGFKADYVNSSTNEGVSVTLLQFKSPAAATAYLNETATKTLSVAASTYKPYTGVPGATEVDGTKAYNGDYDHGVVMARGPYYAQLVYANIAPSEAPFEFKEWVTAQYALIS